MAWLLPKSRRHLEIIRFWIRLTTMDDARLTKRVYLWDKKFKKGNWSKDVDRILQDSNLHHLICNEPLNLMSKFDILKTVKSRLWNTQCEQWKRDIEAQSKLRFYRTFKEEMKVEHFVTINLPMSHRSLLCQLRYGVLPLKVETGRYSNMPLQERICKFCNANEVETELHFLFYCQLYTEIRNSFYTIMNNSVLNFSQYSDEDKLKLVFSQSNFIRKFACYVDSCYRKRSSVLYN